MWSTVESGLGLVAMGGATLRPLFRSFNNLYTQRRSTTHTYPPSNSNPKLPKAEAEAEAEVSEHNPIRRVMGKGVFS
jgi:hypothetical protein